MRSAGPEIGGVTHRLADLEAVLTPLVPALEQLHGAQIEQRRLVVAGELSAMVTINTSIQDISTRIALLEERRQAIQTQLEAELGVQGLRAVLKAAALAPPDRARVGQLLVQVIRLVREIREQGRANAKLLAAAIGAAQRTRQVLQRLSGADNTYDPVQARRKQAAMRARASLTLAPRDEGTPPVQAGASPRQPDEDAVSSTRAALGREAS